MEHDKNFDHRRSIMFELARHDVLDLGDAEAGPNLLRGLTTSYRKNVAQALRMLLTDPTTGGQPFRDNLIQATSVALGVAYGGLLDATSIQERFLLVYPLMAHAVAGVIGKAKPEGWQYIISELGAGNDPIRALTKPARVVVTLNPTNQRKLLGKMSSIYT